MEFDEVFKDCPLNSFLQVSQYGRVKIKDSNIILKQTVHNKHLIVEDPIDRDSLERVHRLVALTWLGEKYEKGKGMVVHHIDGNGFNNRVDNLEWKTKEEHATEHGWDEVNE